MREIVRSFLERRINRRRFIEELTILGVGAKAARAFADSVAASERSAPIVELRDLTGGELVAEMLRRWGVKYVFGIPGSNEVGFVDALVDRPEIRYVMGLHESAVASMADGYGRVSGETPFLNLHAAPGTAYALGGMISAWHDNTPMVVTAGEQDARLRGRGAFLEARKLDSLPERYAKWTWDLLRADTFPEVLRRAFKLAATPPGGPVFITVSRNLWAERVERAELFPLDRFAVSLKIEPDEGLVKEAARWLVEAEYPLFMAGDELSRYGGSERLSELAELVGAPVMGEFIAGHALMNFPTNHPLYLGPLEAERKYPPRIDAFFNFGGKMFAEYDWSAEPILPHNARTIHVGINTEHIARTYPVDLAIVSDVEKCLEALIEEVKSRLRPELRARFEGRRRAVEQAAAARRHLLSNEAAQGYDSTPIQPARLAMELNKFMDRRAIVVSESITSDHYVQSYIDFDTAKGRRYVASSGACLGWGVGAACGAKLARPESEVVLLVGDGCLQFGVQGLWTAARYEIPIVIVIWNNREYQANRMGLVKYNRRSVAEDKYIGCRLTDPEIDHIAIARGYGVHGERVSTPDQIGPALERARRANREGSPYLVDVSIARRFRGADSSWSEKFSVARMRRSQKSGARSR